MFKTLFLITSIFTFHLLEAVIVGCPSDPSYYLQGLFSKNQTLYLRAGYYYENIYRSEYKDENTLNATTTSILKMKSQGSIITLNIKNRWDIYGMIGVSKINIDNQILSKEQNSWGVGTKILLFKAKNFDFSIDGKFFQTKQDVDYFVIDNDIYPIITPNYGFTIQKYQGSAAISYKIKDVLCPYIGATYLYSIIHPYPFIKGLIRYPYPDQDVIDDFIFNNTKNKIDWGFIVGVSIISSNKIAINIESRMIDQNATSITAEIRF